MSEAFIGKGALRPEYDPLSLSGRLFLQERVLDPLRAEGPEGAMQADLFEIGMEERNAHLVENRIALMEKEWEGQQNG